MRPQQTVEVLHEGRLSRAGVAHDPDDLARAKLERRAFERDGLERRAPQVPVPQVADLDDRLAHRRAVTYASASSATVSGTRPTSRPRARSRPAISVTSGTSSS